MFFSMKLFLLLLVLTERINRNMLSTTYPPDEYHLSTILIDVGMLELKIISKSKG